MKRFDICPFGATKGFPNGKPFLFVTIETYRIKIVESFEFICKLKSRGEWLNQYQLVTEY